MTNAPDGGTVASAAVRSSGAGEWMPWWAAGVLAAALWIQPATAARAQGTPTLIKVPAVLMQQNASIEPSGVAWEATLKRYLIISDDTGTEVLKHEPWVFAMNSQGALDDVSVPIRGVSEINDPESICNGPNGTLFICTSHSENKKGKTKPPRRQLLHLKLEGRALRVLGQVDLTTAEDGKGGGLLAIAGVDPGGKLDIEAITYRQGVLLVGLKAPLTAEGSAVILQLKNPVETLRAGCIAPGALTRYRTLDLRVSRAAGMVSRGVADLTTLPDGSIVLCANSPKNMPSDGGGGIYWLKAGASSAVLLHDFPGLKPEGVTLAENGKELVVVFDEGFDPPHWTRWPLPK